MPTGVTSASLIVVIVVAAAVGRHRRRDTGKLCTGGRGCFGVRIYRDSGGRGRKKHIGQSSFGRRTRPRAHPCGRRCVRSHRLDSGKPRWQGTTRSGWRRLYLCMVGHRGGPCLGRSGGPPFDHLSHVPRTLARMSYTPPIDGVPRPGTTGSIVTHNGQPLCAHASCPRMSALGQKRTCQPDF